MPHLRARALLIVALTAALAAPSPARAVTQVSYPALLHEVQSGPLMRAVINRKAGHIEIKFRDLSEWEASYPLASQRHLVGLLQSRHIRVIYASRHRAQAKPRAVHHHLRYIAAGILGAIVLAGGAFLYVRRRRPRESSPGGRTARAS
jgi:hypothetical protein